MDGTINGKQCRLTIDTGAERTFVRADVVAGNNAPLASQRLCGVTGHCVQLKGPVEVSIGLGRWEVVLPVYVADIQEPCLLGLDYLTYSQACVDLGRRKVRVKGTEVPLLPTDDCAEVVVAETVRVAPRTEAMVRCRLSREMSGGGGLVESSVEQGLVEGVAVGRTLVAPDNDEVKVLVANFSHKVQEIPAGAILGTCEEVERDQGATVAMQCGEFSNNQVPKHLQELMQRSAECLGPEQTARLRKLLSSYADVFAKDDLDLGCTNLVQHHIITGNSPPIKQAPRRIAPAKRQEMETAVGELVAQKVVEKSSSPWSSAVPSAAPSSPGRRAGRRS